MGASYQLRGPEWRVATGRMRELGVEVLGAWASARQFQLEGWRRVGVSGTTPGEGRAGAGIRMAVTTRSCQPVAEVTVRVSGLQKCRKTVWRSLQPKGLCCRLKVVYNA